MRRVQQAERRSMRHHITHALSDTTQWRCPCHTNSLACCSHRSTTRFAEQTRTLCALAQHRLGRPSQNRAVLSSFVCTRPAARDAAMYSVATGTGRSVTVGICRLLTVNEFGRRENSEAAMCDTSACPSICRPRKLPVGANRELQPEGVSSKKLRMHRNTCRLDVQPMVWILQRLEQLSTKIRAQRTSPTGQIRAVPQ